MGGQRGISAVIAAVIIVAVAISIAIAFALWVSGVIGSAGYGTRPVKLGVSSFRVLGPTAIFMIQNIGSDRVYIDTITINGREAKILTAYDVSAKNLSLITGSGGKQIVVVDPGKVVEVWAQVPGLDLQPGVTYQVQLTTTLGFQAMEVVKSYRAMIVPPTVEIYIRNIDYTYKVDLIRLKWWVYKGSPKSPGPVKWSGDLILLNQQTVIVTNQLKQQPVIAVRNPYAGKNVEYIIWMNHNNIWYEYGSGYYKLEPVDHAVPGLDFILFFEDAWVNAQLHTGGCDYDYNEHVTRVTWRTDGSVKVAVYFGAHGYTFDVYVGGKYVYTISGWYMNIVDANYNGFHGVDDLRAAIPGKIYLVRP